MGTIAKEAKDSGIVECRATHLRRDRKTRLVRGTRVKDGLVVTTQGVFGASEEETTEVYRENWSPFPINLALSFFIAN
jgi:hypothetical protein